MNAHIISIGDELLIGQVTNGNAATIGQMLTGVGVSVRQITTVSDSAADIIDILSRTWKHCDVVIMTGGLGPTNDDRTAVALATFFGVELKFSEETWLHLKNLLAQFDKTPTKAHRQQCFVPENASLLLNKAGTAPGMHFQDDGYHLFAMPGVPYEMEYVMKTHVVPILSRQTDGISSLEVRTICTVGEGESRIAGMIADIEEELPDHIHLAFLPSPGLVRLRILGAGPEVTLLRAEIDRASKMITARLGELVYATKDISLSEVIGQLLRDRGLSLAVAESCTGGFLGHLITAIPGSSDYFLGGAISYANSVKEETLGVRKDTLNTHGAVSEQTALEMASGAQEQFGSDIGLSITGVAGPDGGSAEKPVGTVWIGIAAEGHLEASQFRFGKDRERNIEFSAVSALNMLRKYLTRH